MGVPAGDGDAGDAPGDGHVKDAALLPDAMVIGEVVEVLHIWYDGDERRGLIARCRRNGQEYPLSLLDLAFPGDSEAARLVAAYRRWLGLDR
jgi:hypothetical protein